MRLRPAPGPQPPARWLLAAVAVLASVFGAGSAVVPVASQQGMGTGVQVRQAPPAATRSSAPAPARAAQSAPGNRAAGRVPRSGGQAHAAAERRDAAAPFQHAAASLPRSGALPRPPRLAWQLARPAASRLPTGLPASRAPPSSTGT